MPAPKRTPPQQTDRKTVCLGDMHSEALAAVRAKKARNLSALIRQALRVYLHPDQRAVDARPLIASLDQLRANLARVGSNLNQIAHAFNIDGPAALKREALAVTHDELREEFRNVVTKLIEIERGLRRENR